MSYCIFGTLAKLAVLTCLSLIPLCKVVHMVFLPRANKGHCLDNQTSGTEEHVQRTRVGGNFLFWAGGCSKSKSITVWTCPSCEKKSNLLSDFFEYRQHILTVRKQDAVCKWSTNNPSAVKTAKSRSNGCCCRVAQPLFGVIWVKRRAISQR